jgi:hypothetical protein
MGDASESKKKRTKRTKGGNGKRNKKSFFYCLGLRIIKDFLDSICETGEAFGGIFFLAHKFTNAMSFY